MKLFKLGQSGNSRELARERLKRMLIQDRIQVSPGIMEELREALLSSVGKYLEVDRERARLSLEVGEKSSQLVATIPIKGVKRKAEHG